MPRNIDNLPLTLACAIILAHAGPSHAAPNETAALEQNAEIRKAWGVEVVGGPTSAKALDRYPEWPPKYAGIICHRESKLVVVGVVGQTGAVHVRVGMDTRGEADKVCAQLHAAGADCEV
jgi:hypothetical protein